MANRNLRVAESPVHDLLPLESLEYTHLNYPRRPFFTNTICKRMHHEVAEEWEYDYRLEHRVTDGRCYFTQKDWRITRFPSATHAYDSITLYGLYQAPSRTCQHERSSFRLLIIPNRTETQSLPTIPVREV